MKKILSFLALILTVFVSLVAVQSHSGNTDASGGHYNRSTGEYHYHHGYPAHSHTDGKCPYDYDDKTGSKSGSAGNVKSADNAAVQSSSVVRTNESRMSIAEFFGCVFTYAVIFLPYVFCIVKGKIKPTALWGFIYFLIISVAVPVIIEARLFNGSITAHFILLCVSSCVFTFIIMCINSYYQKKDGELREGELQRKMSETILREKMLQDKLDILTARYKAKSSPWNDDISQYPAFPTGNWPYICDDAREELVGDYVNKVRACANNEFEAKYRKYQAESDEKYKEKCAELESQLASAQSEIQSAREIISRNNQILSQKDITITSYVKKLRETRKTIQQLKEEHKQEIAQFQCIRSVQEYGMSYAGGDPVPHKYCPQCGLRNADDAEYCRECRHDFKGDSSVIRVSDAALSYMHWVSPKYDTIYQRTRMNSARNVHVLKYDPERQVAYVHSEKDSQTYTTTYRYCTCWDFRMRELPCKHMYAVMINIGIIPGNMQ